MLTTMTDGLSIDLRNVAKVYKGRVHALQGVSMQVRRGEVFGLLGPNGAGKSTLVKIMMTVVRPTTCVGTILGRPVGEKAILARVGYLPENHRFPRYLTGRQTLEFFGALSKVDRPARRRRSAELLDTVGMTAWADRKIATYSKGMAQRNGLAQAMMGDPDLILLDEPTDGVDPVGRRDIRDVILRLREQGRSIFINSHLLSELEMICDRVAILVKGQVARQGTLDELTVAKQRYEVEVEANEDAAATREAIRRAVGVPLYDVGAPGPPAPPPPPPAPPPLDYRSGVVPPVLPGPFPRWPLLRGTLGGGAWVELDGLTLRLGVTGAPAIQPALDALRQQGLVIRRVQPMRQSLEDLFMEAVTDPTTGLTAAPGAAMPAKGGRR
jgi:ABC-2 type transport system ATP-binding protein